MEKADFLFSFIFGVLVTLFVMTIFGSAEMLTETPTAAAIYQPHEMITVIEEHADYSMINEAFQSSEVTTYAAECEPHAYIIGGNVTKYECSLYFEDEVDVKKVAPTGSMWPNLITGGYVLIKEVRNVSDLSVGDIVIINDKSGSDIAHRIVDISYDNLGQYITTQGDNNKMKDSIRFRLEDIEAKVIGILY